MIFSEQSQLSGHTSVAFKLTNFLCIYTATRAVPVSTIIICQPPISSIATSTHGTATTSPTTMNTPNFLVLGATGLTGKAFLKALAKHLDQPSIHAFARTPSKLTPADASLCTSIHKGDATNPDDIEAALEFTQADVIVQSIGVPNSTQKSNVREQSSVALLTVLSKPAYSHVKVVAISAIGAGGTKMIYGWGLGMIASWILKHVIADHDQQEGILRKLSGRMAIVRPTGLGEGPSGAGVQQFVGRAPTFMVQRNDLAEWVVNRVFEGAWWGEAVNVTGSGGEEGLLSYLKRELF